MKQILITIEKGLPKVTFGEDIVTHQEISRVERAIRVAHRQHYYRNRIKIKGESKNGRK